MEKRPGEQRIHPGWWALMLLAFIAAFLFVTSAIFRRHLTSPLCR